MGLQRAPHSVWNGSALILQMWMYASLKQALHKATHLTAHKRTTHMPPTYVWVKIEREDKLAIPRCVKRIRPKASLFLLKVNM